MKNSEATIIAIATHQMIRPVVLPDEDGPSALGLWLLYFVLSVVLLFAKIMSDELIYILINL